MAKLLRVKLYEEFEGYNANSELTVTENKYFAMKAKGIKVNIIAGHVPTSYNKRPLKKDDYLAMHDHPFKIDEEE